MWLNPVDAKDLGLSDHDPAVVESRIGRVLVSVRLTEDIRPGGDLSGRRGLAPVRRPGAGDDRRGQHPHLNRTDPAQPGLPNSHHFGPNHSGLTTVESMESRPAV